MIRKIIRFITGIILLLILGAVIWFALVNYNVIDNPYEKKVELISLSQSEIRLKRKNTFQLTASLVPRKVRNGLIKYTSSNPKVATVNETSGFITAINNGTTVITATLVSDNSIKSQCTVIVSDNDITINKIELNTKSINVMVGETYPITYKVSPRNATLHSISYYSSDDSIASVDMTGKVEGKKVGKVIITLTDKITGNKANINVNVHDKNKLDGESIEAPKNISVSPSLVSLNIGGSRKITVNITPDKTNKNITWRSLNTDIATVSSDGVIVGKSEGTTKIIASTVNGLDAYINVEVVDKIVNVDKIVVEPTSMEIKVGEKHEFNYVISPVNATNQGVMISSSDDEVISINDNNIIGMKEGVAVVTITTVDGDYSAKINVNVKGGSKIINATGLTVNPSVINLSVGSSFELETKVSPSNATYKDVKYASSNPNVATVNNGLIYGVSKGKTEITVKTHNNITKKVVVNVNNVEITNVTLDKSSETIKVGETLSLVKTITPNNASNQNVSWDSSNNFVATVDANGIVTGRNTGTATITVRTNNGKVASCMVTVQ